jgi:hypothetical protein
VFIASLLRSTAASISVAQSFIDADRDLNREAEPQDCERWRACFHGSAVK